MNISLRALLVLFVLLIGTHRLPAPIQEIESPTPAPEQSTKSKPKRSVKPKVDSEASEPATNPARPKPSPKQSRFAATWVGTMPEVPWGNVATELIVDQTEATMEWQESGKRKGLVKAQRIGDMVQGSFPAPIAIVWSVTPQPDGATARVRLQAFMNDQTAIFHRTVSESSAAKPAR
jgi:hypothetical protein